LFLNSFSFYQAIRLLSRKTVNKILYLYLSVWQAQLTSDHSGELSTDCFAA